MRVNEISQCCIFTVRKICKLKAGGLQKIKKNKLTYKGSMLNLFKKQLLVLNRHDLLISLTTGILG